MSYLKALSNFRKQPYGLTLRPYCAGEGFRTEFEKTLPRLLQLHTGQEGFLHPNA